MMRINTYFCKVIFVRRLEDVFRSSNLIVRYGRLRCSALTWQWRVKMEEGKEREQKRQHLRQPFSFPFLQFPHSRPSSWLFPLLCSCFQLSLSPGDRRHSREVEEGRVRPAESGMGNCFTFPARSQSTPPDTRPSSPGMCYWIRKKKHISFFKRKKVTFFF